MKSADNEIIQLLNRIYDAQAGGGGGAPAFAEITGDPADNTALDAALDLKAPLASPTFSGTVVIPTPFTLGAVSVLPTGTELNFVDGVTSAIQTQLNAKGPAPSDAAYDEAAWNGVTTIAPSKNAVRDKIEAVVASIPAAHSGGVVGTGIFDGGGTTTFTNGIIDSQTKLGTGSYRINFTTTQPDTNYVCSVVTGSGGAISPSPSVDESDKTTDNFIIKTFSAAGIATDVITFEVSVMRLSQ